MSINLIIKEGSVNGDNERVPLSKMSLDKDKLRLKLFT